MDNRWSQLVSCIVLGYAGMFLGMFIFDLLDGVMAHMSAGRRPMSFMLMMSIGVYLAWIFGVSTCVFDRLHYWARGLFSTLFLNIGIFWALKNRLHITVISWDSIPDIVYFIVILNILVAAYSGKNFEDKLKDLKTSGEPFYTLTPYAVMYPLVMIGVFWIIMYVVRGVFHAT